MPLYEYDCQGCGNRFEALVRTGDATPSCPTCGSESLTRVLSAFAVNSENTRRSALDAGRKHQAKARRDQRAAEHEDLHHHMH